jgi:hypothetical protein
MTKAEQTRRNELVDRIITLIAKNTPNNSEVSELYLAIKFRRQANRLRQQASRLHRWYEACCNGVEERDDGTAWRYLADYSNYSSGIHRSLERWIRVPNRGKNTEARIKYLCNQLELFYYFQRDPRGAPLYVSDKPLTETTYTSGVAVW